MSEKQAKILYLDGDLEVLEFGDYVPCAVSGRFIHLSQLKYWSVDRQEAYFSAIEAQQAENGVN